MISRDGSGAGTSDSSAEGDVDSGQIDFSEFAFPATAWTGDALFVYGGADDGTYVNAAAFVEPETGDQEGLPEPPFDGALAAPASVVSTDEAIVVLGSLCQEPSPEEEACPPATYVAAALRLADRTWEPLELPDELAAVGGFHEALGELSDGRAVFRLGGSPDSHFWAFSPTDGSWQQLPAPGVRVDDACLAGDSLVAVTARFEYGDEVIDDDPANDAEPGTVVATEEDDGYVLPSLAVLPLGGPNQRWLTTAPLPDFLIPAATETARVSCLGNSAMVHDVTGDNRALHAIGLNQEEVTGSWRRPSPAPTEGTYYTQIWTGRELVFLNLSAERFPAGAPAMAYDPAADSWRSIDGAPLASDSLVWTGESIAGYAESSAGDGGPQTLISFNPGG